MTRCSRTKRANRARRINIKVERHLCFSYRQKKIFLHSFVSHDWPTMVTNTNGVSSIEFNQDWFCYYQPSTDRTDSKTIVANGNNNHWSKTQLPHHLTTKEKEKINHSKPFRWWYCKYFDWCVSRNQQICLIFDPCNRPNQSSNIEATIWLNTIEIFQGSLLSLRDSIELSPHHLRNNENPMNQETFANCLVICCYNMHLYLDAYVFIQGDLVCATGQVQLCDLPSDSNEKHNEVLDYTASMGDTDGLISVNFNAEQISRRTSIKSITSARPVVDEKRMSRNNSGNLDDDLLVPRLAIVILIVGTRGDVQPFIAYVKLMRYFAHSETKVVVFLCSVWDKPFVLLAIEFDWLRMQHFDLSFVVMAWNSIH